ncbi:MAG: hypothetical protein L3J57_01650 [Desulfuromusa sp.]|nr:hypothetical protein [Desulfuromusa sp.]
MQTKRRIIAAKIEGTEGVAETLTATETGILVTNGSYTPDIKMLPRDVLLATFSKLPDLTGVRLSKLTFKAEMIGRGTAYAAGTVPRLSPYLRACGLQETVDVTGGAENVSYQRASSGIPSLTMAFLDDDGAGGAVVKKLIGARGNVKFSGSVGGQLYAEFSFIGAFVDVVDGAQLTASYDDIRPPQLLGTAFTVDGYQSAFSAFDFDMGNTLAGIPDCSKDSGYRGFEITDGDTRGQFDPEMVKVATHDYYGKWIDGIEGALVVGPFGPAQYNRIGINAPNLVTTNVQETERESQMALTVNYQLAMNSGDDEFVLTFS